MVNDILSPPLYSVDIADYWDIAGLPRTITGTFIVPGTGNQSTQISSILTFVSPQPEQNISGWLFAVGGSNEVTIFLKSLNSTGTIYRRRRKTPKGKRLQIDCILYVTDDANTSTKRGVVDRCLRPYIPETGEGIGVRVLFNGELFEIQEYRARRNGSLIFRGA